MSNGPPSLALGGASDADIEMLWCGLAASLGRERDIDARCRLITLLQEVCSEQAARRRGTDPAAGGWVIAEHQAQPGVRCELSGAVLTVWAPACPHCDQPVNLRYTGGEVAQPDTSTAAQTA